MKTMCERCEIRDLTLKMVALMQKEGLMPADLREGATAKTAKVMLKTMLTLCASVAVSIAGTANEDLEKIGDLCGAIFSNAVADVVEGIKADEATRQPAPSREAAQAAFDGLMVGSKH
jgi:hypothetical protein